MALSGFLVFYFLSLGIKVATNMNVDMDIDQCIATGLEEVRELFKCQGP